MEEPERTEPRPMSPFAAIGWTLGVTCMTILLAVGLASLRPEAHGSVDRVTAGGCQVAVYLLGLFLILRVHAPDASIRRFVGFRGTHPLFFVVAPLLGVTMSAFTEVLYNFVVARFPTGDEGKFETVIAEASPANRAAIAVILVLVGPAVEELFFRGALVQALRKSNPLPVVVAVASAAFGLAHIQWQAFVPLAICGAALVVLRLASGSVVPGFVMHAIFNGVGLLEVFRAVQVGDEMERYRGPLFALGVAGTAILAALTRVIARTEAARAARKVDEAV